MKLMHVFCNRQNHCQLKKFRFDLKITIKHMYSLSILRLRLAKLINLNINIAKLSDCSKPTEEGVLQSLNFTNN